MSKFFQILGVLTTIYLAWHITGYLFSALNIGHARTDAQIESGGLEMLEEYWLDNDLESIDCSKRGRERFGHKFGELMTLHASMCTAASNTLPKLGEDWFTPTLSRPPDPPEGFVLIEDDK